MLGALHDAAAHGMAHTRGFSQVASVQQLSAAALLLSLRLLAPLLPLLPIGCTSKSGTPSLTRGALPHSRLPSARL